MLEKRLFVRLTAGSDVKANIKPNDTALNIRALNFSENGFSFISNFKFDIQADSVPIDISIGDVQHKILGVLKWKEECKEGFKYGFFIKTDSKSSYSRQIKELYESKNKGYFLFELTVYLKDINLFGTGYFSRYFDWQGMAREEYFLTVKDYQEILSSGVKLITKKAWTEYINHCTVFQNLILKIQNRNIKRFSFEMQFTYFEKNANTIIASGGQILAFTDYTGKLIPIPKRMLDVILKHQSE